MKEYGNAPKVVRSINLDPSEMMLYLYLPIKMAGSVEIRLPERLKYLEEAVQASLWDTCEEFDDFILDDYYVYLTAKTLYVDANSPGNRPGWHVDGYGSNGDFNYIWHNMNPTEFAIQEFHDIPDDDFESLKAMEAQVDESKIVVYPDNTLLRLDESVVHRVNPNPKAGVRTFIKISVSKHKYDLKGNSHNHLFDYDWPMYDRGEVRNCDNSDFAKTKQRSFA